MDRSSFRRASLVLVLLVLVAMGVFGSVFAQQPPQAQPAAAAPGQTANVTGKGGFIDSADLLVRRIRLEAGARTYWHVHTNDQVIIAEEGEGWYQQQGGPIQKFVPGQAVFLKANVPHWHGAAATTHVVQATMYSGTLKWLDPVTDEEYAGKKKR
jgi:quercetin dioxygenase-like cupin family protein